DAVLPHRVQPLVLRAGERVHPLDSLEAVERGDAVELRQHPRREVGEALVVGRLEGEAPGRGEERAAARDRRAIEAHPDAEEPAAAEGFLEHRGREAAIAFARGERAAALALPAARLQGEELLGPAPDVRFWLEAHVRERAALGEPARLARELPARRAREGALQVALGALRLAKHGAREDVFRDRGAAAPRARVEQRAVERA